MKTLFFFLVFFSSKCFAQDALIYSGDGACQDGCYQAAGMVAALSGLNPIYVRPENYHSSVFDNAKVWLQPGGFAIQSAEAMGQQMMEDVKSFVNSGGGYVGFCAGTFLATKKIGGSSSDGYGFIPGKTGRYYPNLFKSKNVEPMNWKTADGKWTKRYVYWEGGPAIRMSVGEAKNLEVLAYYSRSGNIGAVKAPYGKGRVAASAVHPEASADWFENGMKDPDGKLDHDLAIDMIRWAAGL